MSFSGARKLHSTIEVSARTWVAALLCALLAGQPVLAEGGRSATAGASASEGQVQGRLQGQGRVLHALNRFTFGPRPGDVAAVQAMGVDAWFERQLNPASIE